MKKHFKILILVLVAVISCTGITNVSAKSNLKITKKTYIDTGIEGRQEAKYKTNKGYAFCITPKKKGPAEGATLKYDHNINDGGMRYILEQADSSDRSNLVTRIAVWKYYKDYLPDVYKKHKNKKVVKDGLALAKEAKKHKDDQIHNPSITINNSNKNMKEVNNGKTFKSEAITIKLNHVKKAKISVTSPAVVVNGNGKEVKEVENNDKVYIRVPADKVKSKTTYTVKVSATKTVHIVERYNPSNDDYQSLAVLVDEERSASNKTTVTAQPVVRKCEYANGKYYGKNGNVVDKTTYSIECEKHTCEKVGDKYFGKNGNIVDKTTYSIECEKHNCELVGNTYFGKNGNIVDKTTFTIECDKHVCDQVGDTYFGKSGQKVDEETYDLECNPHACEIIKDKYFGKNGNIVDAMTYDKECNEHVCQKVGDTYFGKDGQETDETTFDLECNQHVCEIVGDKFFGKNGIEVSENTYNAECTHTCEKVGNDFYGIDGTIVTEDEYKDQCVHACEVYDNKYFGQNGQEVDEETYRSECEAEITTVPDTGTNPLQNIILITIGSLFMAGAAAFVIRSNNA